MNVSSEAWVAVRAVGPAVGGKPDRCVAHPVSLPELSHSEGSAIGVFPARFLLRQHQRFGRSLRRGYRCLASLDPARRNRLARA